MTFGNQRVFIVKLLNPCGWAGAGREARGPWRESAQKVSQGENDELVVLILLHFSDAISRIRSIHLQIRLRMRDHDGVVVNDVG